MSLIRFSPTLLVFSLVAALSGCGGSDSPTAPPPATNSDIHVDEGNIGLVIDTREVAKRGYAPATAEVSLPGYARFDTTIAINNTTDLAIFNVHRTRLTTEELTAFGNGVAVNIRVTDSGGTELATLNETARVIDDSNLPLGISSGLPVIQPPLELRTDIAYLIQPADVTGVLTSDCSDCYAAAPYAPGAITQQFTFEPVPGSAPDTYYIHHQGYADGDNWYVWYANGEGVVGMRGGFNPGGPEEFRFVQDLDGWIRILHVPSGKFLYQDTIDLRLNDTGDRFRLISDQIDWQIEDKGTVFNQPVMPPAQLDFAYEGTLRNCSSAGLQEAVGRSETRTRTTTVGTSESLQLFSSSTSSTNVSVGVEVTAQVGVKPPSATGGGEASESVSVSEQVSFGQTMTSSNTSTNSQNWSETKQTAIEVSRTRTVTVPEFTVIEVRDAIKTVRNVRVPFTQTLRIRGTDKTTATPLTGDELVTQMVFSFTTGLVQTVGPDFIDVTLRGIVTIDQLMKATTVVTEVEGGCQ